MAACSDEKLAKSSKDGIMKMDMALSSACISSSRVSRQNSIFCAYEKSLNHPLLPICAPESCSIPRICINRAD